MTFVTSPGTGFPGIFQRRRGRRVLRFSIFSFFHRDESNSLLCFSSRAIFTRGIRVSF